MKPVVSCFFVLFFLYSNTSFAQGNLEPIAGPGPIMRTLQQVEPRTPISTAQTITASGSYYLTNNISGAIVINADDVDLDLNGFTLSSVNSNGVSVSGRTNVTLFNGSIKVPEGLQAAGVGGSGVSGVHVHDLRISGGWNCVSFINPADRVEVSGINCISTQKAGIFVFANSTSPLLALIHDNIISDTNMDLLPGASILISNNSGTNDGTYADVRNNRVYGSEKGCIFVVGDSANGKSSGGTVTGNTTTYCETGIFVLGNFIVTQNIAQNNEGTDYNLVDAPNAAPVTGITDSPGPWHNIATTTPVPEA